MCARECVLLNMAIINFIILHHLLLSTMQQHTGTFKETLGVRKRQSIMEIIAINTIEYGFHREDYQVHFGY